MTQDPYHQLPDYRPSPAGNPIPGTGQYTNPTPANTSAVVLTVISGVLTASGICCVIGIVPLIFGVIGLSQNSSDPKQAARWTRTGWVVLVVLTLVLLLAIAGAVGWVLFGGPLGGSSW